VGIDDAKAVPQDAHMPKTHQTVQAARTCLVITVLALSLASSARGTTQRCAEAVQSQGQTLPALQELAPGVWWVNAQRGEANATNRGQVSNLLVVRDAPPGKAGVPRVWLIGSGPSPMWGQRLRCQISLVVGAPVTDVISPWARPELVLGAKAFHAQHWAHADVARAMRRECARCTERLRQRLGEAAVDLGSQPAEVPTRLLRGERGRLGPFEWHRVQRARGSAVTLWYLPQQGLLTAHGLVWAGGVPDLRDTRAPELSAGLRGLQRVATAAKGLNAVIGEQGSPVGVAEIEQHLLYLSALGQQVRAGQDEGSDGVRPPTSLPGIAFGQAHRLQDPMHALNWQRAWRQADEPPPKMPPKQPRR
jgi:hypothetical protein